MNKFLAGVICILLAIILFFFVKNCGTNSTMKMLDCKCSCTEQEEVK